MDDCEHPLLYLAGTGKSSQETTISGYCQHALVGICHSVWVWWLFMGRIPKWGSLWMAVPSVSALKFVSVTPSKSILLPLLRGFWASGLISTYQWVHIVCVHLWLGYFILLLLQFSYIWWDLFYILVCGCFRGCSMRYRLGGIFFCPYVKCSASIF